MLGNKPKEGNRRSNDLAVCMYIFTYTHTHTNGRTRHYWPRKKPAKNRTISRAIRGGLCAQNDGDYLPRTQTPGNGDDACGKRRRESSNKISDKWIGGERKGRI